MSKIIATTKRVSELMGSTISDADAKNSWVSEVIKGYTADALNLFKNITETSLMQDDFDQRIEDMCKKFGITYSNGKFF